MSTRRVIPTLLVLGLMAAAPSADAASDPECAPTDSVDPLRLLKQASLDLRGEVPSIDEYERVRDAADPEAEVETLMGQMQSSEAYGRTVREYHRSLLWTNVDDEIVALIFGSKFRISRIGGTDRWRVPAKRRDFRGSGSVDCLDQEQTQFDADGRPIPINTYQDPECDDGTCRQEGFVWVNPYWDPSTPIQVCAYDAQTSSVGLEGSDCTQFNADGGCGCGDGLATCGPASLDLDQPFRYAFAEEPLRLFEWIVTNDRSYLEAFTTSTSFANGPLAHYIRNLTGVPEERTGGPIAFDVAAAAVPDLDFTDPDTWVEYEREGLHAGVLTTYGFLARFASDRARANRFYTAFLCDPFVPPEDGIPAEDESPSPNLRERDGCAGCHQVLEPAAAHWGRWRTGGQNGVFREEAMSFETPNDTCLCGEGTDRATCSAFCSTYFVTADNSEPEAYAAYGGLPIAAAWLEDGEQDDVDTGPKALVDSEAEQRQVAECTVRNLATHLLGRDLQADDLVWLEKETDQFIADDHRFSPLLQRLIADDRYRSID